MRGGIVSACFAIVTPSTPSLPLAWTLSLVKVPGARQRVDQTAEAALIAYLRYSLVSEFSFRALAR
jgi:hypothetical protein